MLRIELAGIKIQINNKYKYLRGLCQEYFSEFETPDMEITPDAKEIESQHLIQPEFPKSYCEGVVVYREICRKLPLFNAVMLHSSMIEKNGKAYAICGQSGAGKSTHTMLLLKNFGESIRVINGDKPIVRFFDDEPAIPYAYGTPWSGKTDESVNEGVPIAGIAFLSRGKANEIKRLSGVQALKNFLDQTIRPHNKEYAGKMLEVLDGVLTDVPVFALACDMSEEAVRTSYNAMNREVEV
jgi:hypothetical protein